MVRAGEELAVDVLEHHLAVIDAGEESIHAFNLVTIDLARAQARAVDATVTVREGDVWSAGFGVGYLSNSYGTYYVPGLGNLPIEGLDVYHLEGRMRLNEEYEAFVRGDYDAYNHLFVDEFYGISQKISNTWIVEYALEFSNGPNNGQGHFGLNVTLNMVRF